LTGWCGAGRSQRCFQWGSSFASASSARREVVERQQRIAVLGQAIGSSLVFDLVGFDKGFQCRNGILLGLGHPDLLQRALGLGVQALRHLVQDIGGFVHPAALLAGCRPHFAERFPEPERAVGDRNLRRRCQAATLQIEQQITPRLCALANAIGEADKLLLAFRRRADDDQDALRLLLEPGLLNGCRRPSNRRSALLTDRASASAHAPRSTPP
jgi:hypothetical protein